MATREITSASNMGAGTIDLALKISVGRVV